MADQEKVIECLESTIHNAEWANKTYTNCDVGFLKDILALLKAQEPRVFNVVDFFGEEFGYLEYRPDRPGFSNFEPSSVLIGDIDDEYVTVAFHSASVQKLPLDGINKNWRIWSNYPTHEQLRAKKWDG